MAATESDTTTEASMRGVVGCSFCEEITDPREISSPLVRKFFDEVKDRMLLETSSTIVVPSLGALVPGHLLALPKHHYYSVGEVPPSDLIRFESVVKSIRSILRSRYGSCSGFEHGCVEKVGKAGACIDHAHLHLIPLAKDLRSSIESKFGPGSSIQSLVELRKFFLRRMPYLYYEAPDGTASAYEAPQAPSQFLRQLASISCPSSGNWDWKADLRTDIVKKTLLDLQDEFAALERKLDAA